jgi:hypothetical protein
MRSCSSRRHTRHHVSVSICCRYFAGTHVTEITDVLDLGMFHDELVHRNRCNVKKNAGYDHCNDTWHPSEHARICKLVFMKVTEAYIR